ncbi:beta-ketoacyl-ACP synthase II [Polyangium jinanense]|uniref:3-oxoacyl-[acyl-carrier-protein] synthase 2 n=1 Tax=Polyangium jinanense TaxID=2829994 RepID=A0A9X3XA38_9BACT|nr:beta-ketoacyl-ACP synthase II [Polyangium jinanense]MDC3957126.1 beta-ketoacyl-ACP synthase II [Polyangium jinanense]MDC3986844.1 beta-ketoacyl-ACP synthase II [Polyangium jinanense]
MERVVITGIGLVTPNGIGTTETWRSVLAAESGIGPITLFDASQYSTRIAGEVKGFVAENFIPKKKLREMGRFAHLSIAASQLCMNDAGIELTDEDRETCGTYIGVGLGGLENLYQYAQVLLEKGPSKVSPYFIPQVIANLAAGQVAMAFDLKGPSYCNTSACASSAHSIGEAFEWIRRGRTHLMLAGGTEATITGLAAAGFGAMFALSRRNDEPTRASRPWDKGRDGFVMGEGAATLLLESLSHAKRRGAKIYGEVTGYGATCDAYHLTKPAPEGEGAQRAMKQALVDAKLAPTDIEYINAHGTSTPHGDLEEARAIVKVFGEHATGHALWVSSTKSVTGHLLGGAGAVEAALSVLALHESKVPPTANLEEQDPECVLDCVPLVARERRLRNVMSNSFGFGGTNVALVFSRFEG